MLLLARLRVLIFSFLLFCSFSYSREDLLFTSSVTYCEPPESLLIQQFNVVYFQKNQSVTFNISAASVQANVSVKANLLLNAYGMHPLNVTLDLCHFLDGALCPLPMYNFTGSDSISLPPSLAVAKRIPNIAFRIPDLEGFVQLVLTEIGTGDVKACVQATLSNGWSTHQPAVEWVTGGMAIATLLSALWPSSDSALPFRLLDLLHFYQFIAASSFLSLNYPTVYRAFTLNFAWAMGLFPSSSLQSSIDRLRHLTGGALADSTSAAAVGLVNRKLSPYNAAGVRVTSSPLQQVTIRSNFPFPSKLDSRLATEEGVQTVTTASSNVLQAGIPIYVNSIHIATANAFMTLFLCGLILIASVLGAFLLRYVLLAMIDYLKGRNRHRLLVTYEHQFFMRAWCIRLGLVLISPIVILSFHQWTLKDSWLTIFLSVIASLVILFVVLRPTFITLRLARRFGSDALFCDAHHLASHGPLYAQYHPPRFYLFLLPLLACILRGIIIAFLKGNGEVQVILMVIVEGFVAISYIAFHPFSTKGGNIFSACLAIIRFVCTGLTIAFVERFHVTPIPRVAVGIVITVILSATVLVTYINVIMHSGVQRLWKRTTSVISQASSNRSILEKGEHVTTANSYSSERLERPINPTPEQSVPFDPRFLQPHPASPTDTELPSVCTGDSRTITVGSLLPRRWSFSSLNSPTNSHEQRLSHNSYGYANSDNDNSLPKSFNTSAFQRSDQS